MGEEKKTRSNPSFGQTTKFDLQVYEYMWMNRDQHDTFQMSNGDLAAIFKTKDDNVRNAIRRLVVAERLKKLRGGQHLVVRWRIVPFGVVSPVEQEPTDRKKIAWG